MYFYTWVLQCLKLLNTQEKNTKVCANRNYLSTPLHFKLKKIQDFSRASTEIQGLLKEKRNSRLFKDSPKIQGLFKTVRTLAQDPQPCKSKTGLNLPGKTVHVLVNIFCQQQQLALMRFRHSVTFKSILNISINENQWAVKLLERLQNAGPLKAANR